MNCAYCEAPAVYTLKNGKSCCRPSPNQCPVLRAKNTDGLRKAHAEGRMPYDHFEMTRAWSKGRTCFTDPRIRSYLKGEEIFTANSMLNTSQVREIILKEKLLPYVCDKCGNEGIWCDEPVTLDLDHKNGDSRDHRLENLHFLCPNCHSQTPTFKGKNRGTSKVKVPDSVLLCALKNAKSIRKALISVGLTGSGNYGRAYRLLARELQPPPSPS